MLLATSLNFMLFTSCGGLGNSNFEGTWACNNDKNSTLKFNKIGNKTYEVDLEGGPAFSGEVNEDGILVVEMLGNVSRFSINKGELRFSGVFADKCVDYVRQ